MCWSSKEVKRGWTLAATYPLTFRGQYSPSPRRLSLLILPNLTSTVWESKFAQLDAHCDPCAPSVGRCRWLGQILKFCDERGRAVSTPVFSESSPELWTQTISWIFFTSWRLWRAGLNCKGSSIQCSLSSTLTLGLDMRSNRRVSVSIQDRLPSILRGLRRRHAIDCIHWPEYTS